MTPKEIYADYAATTPVADEVIQAMLPFFSESYGNASGLHSFSKRARNAVQSARETVAEALGALHLSEVIFTSGGTESNHLAITGLALAHGHPGDRVITTSVEHAAVSQPLEALGRLGFEVVVLPVDQCGVVSVEALKTELNDRTVLVSAMMVNNEVGTVQPISEIGSLLQDHRALFHSDAVQAVRAMPIDVNELKLDALTLSAHKFYGPKGVGALWVRSGVELVPAIVGGGQERGTRGGTENVPGIVGLAAAIDLTGRERVHEVAKLFRVSERVVHELTSTLADCKLTGHPTKRHPGIASFIIDGADGESLLVQLDRLGVAASTGSACSTRSGKSSRVLEAMGLDRESLRGSLRFSFGRLTTEEEVDQLLVRTVQAVEFSTQLA